MRLQNADYGGKFSNGHKRDVFMEAVRKGPWLFRQQIADSAKGMDGYIRSDRFKASPKP